jgi:CysZ protein
MKIFLAHFKLGIMSYFEAIHFIRKHKLYWYFFIPALLMLGIYYLGTKVASWSADWVPGVGCTTCENMNDTIWFLLELLLYITLGLILMKFAKYIVVIVLSPLLAVLSQVVEKKVTGNYYPFELKQTLHDVKRGIRIALRNIMWEYIIFLMILIVAFIGWESPTSSPVFYLTYLVGFFYYGFSFIDYINERRRLNIDQSIHFMRKHKGLAVAIGAVFSLMILVPVDIGQMFNFANFLDEPFKHILTFIWQLILWALASMAPILAITAATLAMHNLVDLNNNLWSKRSSEQSVNEN